MLLTFIICSSTLPSPTNNIGSYAASTFFTNRSTFLIHIRSSTMTRCITCAIIWLVIYATYSTKSCVHVSPWCIHYILHPCPLGYQFFDTCGTCQSIHKVGFHEVHVFQPSGMPPTENTVSFIQTICNSIIKNLHTKFDALSPILPAMIVEYSQCSSWSNGMGRKWQNFARYFASILTCQL